MKKLFAGTQHYVVLALNKGGISFPTTKKEILAKAGNESIRVDWDSYVPLSELIKDVKAEQYENKCHFFNAWIGTTTKI